MGKWWIGRGNVTETAIAVLQVNVFDHSDPHSTENLKINYPASAHALAYFRKHAVTGNR